MRHETYIDVLKSVILTVVCLVSFPLLLPAISPSQDPIGEEEEEQSVSISMADSLSDASADDDMSSAVETSISRDLETSDVVSDDVDSVPEWYVPAVIPNELRAPMRASAAGCLTDSILTFNQDSVLTEATTYDYDAAGRTIRTTVWQYNADGSRTGKSKQEYAFDANGTQIYTGTFAWDAATNDWKGTAKSEYVYNEAHKMESNITYTWVNNTWLPSQALTYAYDAAGRETEFTTYARNASLNRLVPSKQRLQTWYNASKKTLEINYTAYTNGAWSAGNKKEYDYDAKGNQIEYTYYASYSGGNWVGSTHELWIYNAANKKTYYKKETWSNNTWTVSNEEFTGYDAAGNTILIENYALKNGVLAGSKKEEYTFNIEKKKICTITYKWTNGEWENNTLTVADYQGNNQILDAKYIWQDSAWVGKGNRVETIFASGMTAVILTSSWDVTLANWMYTIRRAYTYDGAGRIVGDTTQHFINSEWVNYALITHLYDQRGYDTLSITSGWDGASWVMVSISRLEIENDVRGNIILSASYTCNADTVWIGQSKTEYLYDSLNHRIMTLGYEWRMSDWRYKWKMSYVYDADQIVMEQRTIWQNNAWVGDYWYEYAYDSLGRQTHQASYSWGDGAWRGGTNTVSTYGTNGLKETQTSYTWLNGAWVPSTKTEYAYDANNRQVEVIYLLWNNTDQTWAQSLIAEYAYSNSGELIGSWEWKKINDEWLIESQMEKHYDTNHKLQREINGKWYRGDLITFSDKHYFYSCDAPTVNNGSQPRTPTELEEIDENNAQPFDPTQPAYNLQGQRVEPGSYQGIVVQNGKKYILR